MVNLGSAVAYLKLNTGQFDSSLQTSQSKLVSAGKTIGKGLAVVAAAAVTGLTAVGKSSIDTGKQFDQAMSQVAATMGKTTDQIIDLRDFAMEMGATTAFSATQAAEALNYMALAGYDTEKSMEMLPTVLNLAAAGGMELARASDMITDAESALNLKTGEAAQMVDQMAQAASKSNTSVEQLGEAMLTIGGTATLMSGGTDRLATVLGILADNGIKGSEAGTHLRNMLLKLSAPTKDGAVAMEALGLNVFDADGKMRDMQDIVMDLGSALSSLTDEEKIQYISTIFNSRDIAAVNALLNTTKDRWDELGGAIVESQDAAKKMAETQLDNLQGDVTLLKSAWEGMQITLSDKLTPALRKFVQFGTKEIGKLDKAFNSGGIEGFAEQIGKTLGLAASMLIEKAPVIVSSVIKLVSSMASSVGVALKKNFPKLLKFAINTLNDIGKSLGDAIPQVMGGIGEILGEVITKIPDLIGLAWNIVKGLGEGILKGIPRIAEGIWNGFKGLFSAPLAQEVQDSEEYLDQLSQKLDGIGMNADEMYDKISGAESDAKLAEYWLDVFERLYKKTNLTKEEQLLLNKAVEYLNSNVLPDTAKIIQDENGDWQANTEEIYNNIQAMKDRKMAEIYLEKANSELEKMVELEIEIGKKNEEMLTLKGRKDELTPKIEELNNKFREYQDELSSVQEATQSLYPSYEQGTLLMKEYAASIGITEDNFTSWDAVTQSFIDTQDEMRTELNSVDRDIVAHNVTLGKMKSMYSGLEQSVDSYIKTSAEWSAKSEGDINNVVGSMEDGAPKVERKINEITSAMNFTAEARDHGEEGGSAFVASVGEEIDKESKTTLEKVRSFAASLVSAFNSKTGGLKFSPSIGGNSQGSYASGLDYVPKTMDVTVHRGERILTQEENRRYNQGGSVEIVTYQNDNALVKLGSKLDKILEAIDNFEGFKMFIDKNKFVGAIKNEMNMQLAEDYTGV